MHPVWSAQPHIPHKTYMACRSVWLLARPETPSMCYIVNSRPMASIRELESLLTGLFLMLQPHHTSRNPCCCCRPTMRVLDTWPKWHCHRIAVVPSFILGSQLANAVKSPEEVFCRLKNKSFEVKTKFDGRQCSSILIQHFTTCLTCHV